MSEQTPLEFWEQRYGESDRIWSGKVNRALCDVAAMLEPGRALDLGCGEGGDAVWLAEHGWTVTGVDLSPTAVSRGSAAAAERGVADRVTLVAADLTTWTADRAEQDREGEEPAYELVSASFLQSPVDLPREEVLRRAAGLVAPGGHLLLVAHAAPPPWTRMGHAGHEGHEEQGERDGAVDPRLFPTPDEEVAALALPSTDWDVRIAETRSRPATGPDGQEAVLEDSVVLVRRDRRR